MGSVKITIEKRGGRPCCIQGALVKFTNNKIEDQYGAVKEPRFQRAEFCWAKYQIHQRCQYCLATMSTGFCFKTHACKGYACVHFVDERKNKQRQKDVKNKWLPCVQINNVSKSRRAKPVNWYSPPDKGSKK